MLSNIIVWIQFYTHLYVSEQHVKAGQSRIMQATKQRRTWHTIFLKWLDNEFPPDEIWVFSDTEHGFCCLTTQTQYLLAIPANLLGVYSATLSVSYKTVVCTGIVCLVSVSTFAVFWPFHLWLSYCYHDSVYLSFSYVPPNYLQKPNVRMLAIITEYEVIITLYIYNNNIQLYSSQLCLYHATSLGIPDWTRGNATRVDIPN